MKRSLVALVALGLVSAGAQRASASSYADATLVQGSVQLYAQTGSVAIGGGENAWIAEQQPLIEADLEQLRPGVQALIAEAERRFEGFEPIPWRDDLESCEQAYGEVRAGACYWERRFETRLIPRRSDASGRVRMRIAVAHYPSQDARGAIHQQLGVLADGGSPTFAASAEAPLALPAILFSPWPWIGLAVLGVVAAIVLRRRRA